MQTDDSTECGLCVYNFKGKCILFGYNYRDHFIDKCYSLAFFRETSLSNE